MQTMGMPSAVSGMRRRRGAHVRSRRGAIGHHSSVTSLHAQATVLMIPGAIHSLSVLFFRSSMSSSPSLSLSLSSPCPFCHLLFRLSMFPFPFSFSFSFSSPLLLPSLSSSSSSSSSSLSSSSYSSSSSLRLTRGGCFSVCARDVGRSQAGWSSRLSHKITG